MRSDYNERKAARIERYKERAEKAEEHSGVLFDRASRMASVIPFGQPILIGHHSERRDRNYRDKIDRTFVKGMAEHKKAKHYEQRAAAAERNTAISSDDPDAIESLQEKLQKLEEKQEWMKKVNKAYRTGKLADIGLSEEQIARINHNMEKAYSWERQPFPAYSLQNNNANIRRLKERITHLERLEATPTTEETFGEVTVTNNTEENRVQITFPDKPSDDVRALLKSYGFRWSPSVGCWQRQCSNMALYWAREAAKKAAGIATT